MHLSKHELEQREPSLLMWNCFINIPLLGREWIRLQALALLETLTHLGVNLLGKCVKGKESTNSSAPVGLIKIPLLRRETYIGPKAQCGTHISKRGKRRCKCSG